MSLTPGSRIGLYEIGAQIGVGGMGEVYRALDINLERQVAIKILPDTFAHDPERLARFEREAKTLASLNHPNIAQIHGLEKADGIRALVMELVEGPTLAERIAEGPIPVDEALVIAKQIAEALEAAHEKGIVHRDLKPANIKITPEGAVKVLDFGLAKAFDGERAADLNVTQSPTLSMAATRQGIILGTAAYMSPEQARGHAVDKRADVWAFGCVLYEMLTGRMPFPGRDVTDILATVLKSEPDWAALPAGTSESIRRLLRRCLEKNPKLRLREVGTAIVEIRDAEAVTPALEPRGQTAGRRSVAAAWALGAAVGAALAGLGVWGLLRSQPPLDAPVRLMLGAHTGPPVASFFGPNLAISPDGRRLVYIAAAPAGDGHTLYVRDLDQLDARRLPETEVRALALGFVSPFFSADGLEVGFRSAGKGILRVPLDGGTPRKILDDQFISGAAWASDDRIIIALADGLYRVSATGGGSPERLTPEPKEGLFYSAPALLPGERAVLFEEVRLDAAGTGASIGVLDLETREQRILLENAVRPLYVPSGHLLFARAASLMAVAFDPGELAVAGDPVPLPERVRIASFGPDVRDYSVSRNGTLAYVVGGTSSVAERLVWVDRRGHVVGRAVDDPIDSPRDIRLSPDGRRVVAVTGQQNAGALWIYHLDGRPPLPLTEQADNEGPIWSPDGTRVAFMSDRGGTYDVYVLPADGSAVAPQPLLTWGFITRPGAWLRGDDLMFAVATNIMAAPLSGASKPRDVLASQFAARRPAVSPDERWLAFVSNRTGSSEVWVQGYPDGAPTRVSRSSGDEPVWSRDGRELFYREGTKMMTVAVRTTTGRTFTFDPPVLLFDQPELSRVGAVGFAALATYDVGRDGRFLMTQPVAESQRSTPGDIVVVENWLSELRRLAPVR